MGNGRQGRDEDKDGPTWRRDLKDACSGKSIFAELEIHAEELNREIGPESWSGWYWSERNELMRRLMWRTQEITFHRHVRLNSQWACISRRGKYLLHWMDSCLAVIQIPEQPERRWSKCAVRWTRTWLMYVPSVEYPISVGLWCCRMCTTRSKQYHSHGAPALAKAANRHGLSS